MYKYDVSIVIPIYNNQKYIRDCVKSILNQDYKDFKKIQVDFSFNGIIRFQIAQVINIILKEKRRKKASN